MVGGVTCVFCWLVSMWLDTTEGSWIAGYAFLPVLLIPLLMAGGAAGKTLGWFELPGGCLAVGDETLQGLQVRLDSVRELSDQGPGNHELQVGLVHLPKLHRRNPLLKGRPRWQLTRFPRNQAACPWRSRSMARS